MKHIAIIIFFGVLIQGCSGNRNKEVSIKAEHKVKTERLSSAPIASEHNRAAVVPGNTHVRTQTLHRSNSRLNSHSSMRNDSVTTGRAAPSIQPRKKGLHAMTFNEAQYSDKKSTFPRSSEALKLEKEKYNN